jgi:signal transduction histidine kinase/BarA-like signal transduction histidine kinase
MKKIYQRLFGSSLTFRQILFNIISFVGLIGGTISLAVSLATGLPVVQDIVVTAALAVLVLCLYLANEKGLIQLASVIIILLVTVVLLPMMFFTGGGVYSGMPSWFVSGMVFTFLLIEGKLCWWLLAVQGVTYIVCIWISYLHPQMIQMFPTEAGRYIDITQSMFIAAFTIGLIIQFQSGTYRKMLQKYAEQNRQLEEAKQAADQANSAKTQFLSHMSHDIRTPINGIIGMLDIADDNPDDPGKQAYCRKNIRTASNHLLSLINDVLDISMLESGTVHFAQEAFDIRQLVQECVDITREGALEKGIEISTDTAGITHPYLTGSPLHVRQILINIVGNAVKYNREKGSIRIKAEETGTVNGTVQMKFRIDDTGIGMSDDFLKKIYEPFTQADNGARTQYAGTGLGMSITKQLVDQMGGQISVTSETGVGTSFTVQLPFKEADASALAPQAEETAADSLTGLHVLLVEDNELNQEIARYMLENAGAQVTCAGNGRQALEGLENSAPHQYDCVLMDIMMPVMNGLEAAEAIRKLNRKDLQEIPIIAMSANAYSQDVEKAKQAGMNGYLIKPIETRKMIHLLSAYHHSAVPQA